MADVVSLVEALLNPDQGDPFDADFKEDFNQGMLRMLSEGSSNDVRIILSDGEIMANKDVLAAQSEYFAANFRFKEKAEEGSDHIDITDCSKEVMERIIKYLFTGSIKFKDLGLLQLLELLNQVRKMLLKSDLKDLVESYIKYDLFDELINAFIKFEFIEFKTLEKLNNSVHLDIIGGLNYVDRFVIENVNPYFLAGSFVLLPSIAQDNGTLSAFTTLPYKIVKDLFSVCLEKGEKLKNKPLSTPKAYAYNSAQLRCLLAWLNQNQNEDSCQEDKKSVLAETIDLDSLPAADLFKLVKPSGLFPDDEVDRRIFECLLERDEMKKNRAGS